MKYIVYLIITLATLISGFAQNNVPQEIVINSLITGDLYSATPQSKQLAIIVPGSGPTNRNGNNHMVVKGDSYKMLATELAKKGLSTFTYDKRVISMLKTNKVNEKEMTFDQNIEDLQAVIQYFVKTYPEIILIGHSEGALIANLTAISNKNVTHFISLQGPGKSADQILNDQIAKQAPMISKQVAEINARLKKGELVSDIPPMLKSIFRSDVQPYLISWMKYDPSLEIKKVKQPILIIDGDKDLQVDLEQGKLLQQAVPNSKRVTLSNMNHLLKQIEKDEDNTKSYQDPSFALQPELVPTIIKFVKVK